MSDPSSFGRCRAWTQLSSRLDQLDQSVAEVTRQRVDCVKACLAEFAHSFLTRNTMDAHNFEHLILPWWNLPHIFSMAITATTTAGSWSFGAVDSGFYGKIILDDRGGISIQMLEGSMELNALYLTDNNDDSLLDNKTVGGDKIKGLRESIEKNIKTVENDISFYENNKTCPTCTQEIREEHRSQMLSGKQRKLEDFSNGLSMIHEKVTKIERSWELVRDKTKELPGLEIPLKEFRRNSLVIGERVEVGEFFWFSLSPSFPNDLLW